MLHLIRFINMTFYKTRTTHGAATNLPNIEEKKISFKMVKLYYEYINKIVIINVVSINIPTNLLLPIIILLLKEK
jgi:hypothetical protein